MAVRLGGQDPFIPRSDVAVVESAVAGHPGAEIHVQEDAGHAFHNRVAPMFYRPEAAARAWELTVEFLQRTLPA
ncbi:dienelactone hydrolase family protein [Amycolatopsis carbonis]|uniref:dienelactone hydrolase family protein n=1 Tax=Amycolatopsis carbonis TaxID=715471 RepID=UPI003DA6E9FE